MSFKSVSYVIPKLGLSYPVFTSCSFFPSSPSTSVFTQSPLSVFQSHVAAGSGEPGGDEYHSLVLYHNNSPRWAEQIKLPIPVDMFRGSHVRFEFRHCSSKWDQDRAYTIHLTKIKWTHFSELSHIFRRLLLRWGRLRRSSLFNWLSRGVGAKEALLWREKSSVDIHLPALQLQAPRLLLPPNRQCPSVRSFELFHNETSLSNFPPPNETKL